MLEAILARNPADNKTYVEDVFNTYIYSGTGQINNINTNLAMVNTAEWNIFTLLNGNSSARASAVDSSGNLYIAGNVTVSSLTYGLVVKYDSTGTILWQKYLYQNTTQFNAIDVDSSGNVYVGGQAQDATSVYMLIAKYNSSGTLLWSTKYRQNYSYCYGLKVDSSANIYVSGEANDGTRRYISTLKLDTNGAITWQRYAFESIASTGLGVAVDSSGNVASVGYSLVAGGNYYTAILYYNSSGTLQWTKSVSLVGFNNAGVTFDSSGNLYIATASIILKFNSVGTLQWQKSVTSNFTATNTVTLNSICIDSLSNIYITGSEQSGSYDQMYIASLNSSGNLLWQRNVTNSPYTYSTYGYGIALNSSGILCIAGQSTNGTSTYAVTLKIKTDGTTTSGKALLSMCNGSATVATGSATVSTTGLTTGTSSISIGGGGIAEATVTPTTASYKQSEVTNSGGGGLVWIKSRSGATDHALYDTIRGVTSDLVTNSTAAQTTQSTGLVSFNSNGFSFGSLSKLNGSGATYAAWTFQKRAKFFDVITYTGNGANRTISHNLSSVPGMIIIKRTDTTTAWAVYHRSLANTQYLVLNTNAGVATGTTYWNSTTPTSTVFSLGTATEVNANGGTYVAYLFAHNAGGFGLTGGDNVISCGSFTTDSGGNATVDLGWEPQFVLSKCTSLSSLDWVIEDSMRSFTSDNSFVPPSMLYPNGNNAEVNTLNSYAKPIAGGFTFTSGTSPASQTFIYVAIRRGPMRTPTDATNIFAPITYAGNDSGNYGFENNISVGFPGDMAWIATRNQSNQYALAFDKLRGRKGALYTSLSSAEEDIAVTNTLQSVTMNNDQLAMVGRNSINGQYNATNTNFISWIFRRSPKFFDIVCYTGTSIAQTISHNLLSIPELVMIKRRNGTEDWQVYAGVPSQYLVFNSTAAAVVSNTDRWNNTAPTSTLISLGTNTSVNTNGGNYVAYLFASCPGVSKIGSYTGTGTTQQINCGFTSGARFVLIKRTDSTGSWYVWDTKRGIVAANDPYLLLNAAGSEVTNTDYIDPYSAGFELSSTAPAALNESVGTTWTSRTSGFTSLAIYATTYGNGVYVAGGTSGTITTSTNGIDWTSRTSNFGTGSIYGLSYGNGLFLAFGDAGKICSSPNGTTWTARTSGVTDNLIAGAYGASLYAVCGTGGTIITSPDGVTWTSRTSNLGGSDGQGICFANGLFVVVANSGKISTSPDGITWTAQTSGYNGGLYDITYANGLYVAVGQSGTILTSLDGVTWTSRTSGTANTLWGVTYGQGYFVAVGANGTLIVSTDGINWTSKTSGLTTPDSIESVTFGNGLFVAAGSGGKMITSSIPNYIYLAIA